MDNILTTVYFDYDTHFEMADHLIATDRDLVTLKLALHASSENEIVFKSPLNPPMKALLALMSKLNGASMEAIVRRGDGSTLATIQNDSSSITAESSGRIIALAREQMNDATIESTARNILDAVLDAKKG